ncbi:MAG: Hsp20/alpha crystallin family protein [bacterium]|nr:Hsp20/alpha crystallin family protein [bacterium]
MALVRYNPRDYRPVGFGNLIDRFFNDSVFTNDGTSSFTPQVDIAETDKDFELQFAVPGLKKEDISIDLEDGTLTVGGERKFEETKKEKNFHSVETRYGSFKRSFKLPENVAADKVEASYKDGILLIQIPKTEIKKEVKTISIK